MSHAKLFSAAAFKGMLTRKIVCKSFATIIECMKDLISLGWQPRHPGRLEKDFTSLARGAIPTGRFRNNAKKQHD
jgi:hypothetical protein